jgi:hypothetical protein
MSNIGVVKPAGSAMSNGSFIIITTVAVALIGSAAHAKPAFGTGVAQMATSKQRAAPTNAYILNAAAMSRLDAAKSANANRFTTATRQKIQYANKPSPRAQEFKESHSRVIKPGEAGTELLINQASKLQRGDYRQDNLTMSRRLEQLKAKKNGRVQPCKTC